MKARFTLVAALVAASLPGLATAVGNTSNTTQAGINQSASITQSDQVDADAVATIEQNSGQDNIASIFQGRSNYTATIIQDGNTNQAYSSQMVSPPSSGSVDITQDGDRLLADVNVMGEGGVTASAPNVVVVNQVPTGGTSADNQSLITVAGFGNTITTNQDSDLNVSEITLIGGSGDNMVDVTQSFGNDNMSEINGDGATNAIVSVEQGGNGATLLVNLNDSSFSTVTTLQDGDDNDATVDITGDMNVAMVTQQGGNGNTALIDIDGSGNSATILQDGCNGCSATEIVQ